MYKVFDYRCGVCGLTFTETVDCEATTEHVMKRGKLTPVTIHVAPTSIEIEHDPQWDKTPNPCKGPLTRMDAAPLVKTIVRGNADYAQRERERLTRRSHEHHITKGKEEAIYRERKAHGLD